MPGGWTWACDSGWVEWVSSSPGLDWEGRGVSLGMECGGGKMGKGGVGTGTYPFASHGRGCGGCDLMVGFGG